MLNFIVFLAVCISLGCANPYETVNVNVGVEKKYGAEFIPGKTSQAVGILKIYIKDPVFQTESGENELQSTANTLEEVSSKLEVRVAAYGKRTGDLTLYPVFYDKKNVVYNRNVPNIVLRVTHKIQ